MIARATAWRGSTGTPSIVSQRRSSTLAGVDVDGCAVDLFTQILFELVVVDREVDDRVSQSAGAGAVGGGCGFEDCYEGVGSALSGGAWHQR